MKKAKIVLIVAVSVLALRRVVRARSMKGGFHKRKVLAPCGEPSSEMTVMGRPVSRWA